MTARHVAPAGSETTTPAVAPTEFKGLPVLTLPDVGAWEDWLAAHHDTSAGVFLRVAKKGAEQRTVTTAEALDVALCYGWIDSVRNRLDDAFFLQKYSPRRRQSRWSAVNVAKVEQLLAAGRMRPAGLAQVEAAKADGRWQAAYPPQRDAEPPPDLAAALAADPDAARAFEALNRTDRFLIIVDLVTARKAATREARLARALATLRA